VLPRHVSSPDQPQREDSASPYIGEVMWIPSGPVSPRLCEVDCPLVYLGSGITARISADSREKESTGVTQLLRPRDRYSKSLPSSSSSSCPCVPRLQGSRSKRWCQFGLLSSHSRLHGSATARVPWSIDDEACLVLSKFTKLKNRLEPYLTSLSLSGAVALGHPLMRAMFLEFPEDRSMWYLDQQYMLGGSLLVAPVFGESEVEYYLPSGTWTNILTGQETEGSGWKKESHSMMTLPVLLRPGHAVIMGREGHRVTDSIAKRGFTVMVSRQITERTTISTALRGGKTIDIVLEPLKDASSSTVSGIKIAFDVVVLGGGLGLDSQNLVAAEAQNGVCEVRFA
jgi:hypothetical protein